MPSILVVEDNPATRKMLRVTLVVEGYAVIEAANAREALAAAEQALPDLILQDLILPDMDGLELLRRLRGIPGGTEVPILALSGFLSRLEEMQTDRDGFTALLVKPIEPSRLIDVVHTHLPRQPATATSRGHGRRLLIVDDDPVQLKLSRLHFSQLGFEVTTVGRASDALVAARAKRPDVILSDVFMPLTDGFDLCLEVRRDPELADVPVVLLSAQYGSRADEDLAHRVGASALVPRTPDFGHATPAALRMGAPAAVEPPSDQLALSHARLVIHRLERQAAATAGVTQRCGIQAGQLALLSGVADALTRKSDPDVVLRDVLAATLDAAGISKGALILKDDAGRLTLRQDIGFSDSERTRLRAFFGHSAVLEDIVDHGASVLVPSPAIPSHVSRDILAGADVTAAHIVPLISDGRGVGAMVIGATSTDVTGDDCVAFARAMGNQVVQSLELANTVGRLTASEQRYRALLEQASQERDRAQGYLDTAEVILLALDLGGRVTLINRKGCDLLGWSVSELVGCDFIEMCVPAGIRDATREALGRVHAGDDSVVESPVVTRGGDERTIEWRTTFLRDPEGRIISTLSSGTDVTARNHTVEALRTAEERMRFALQNAEVGIWDMDYTTGALRWSDTLEAQYGLPPGTFAGTDRSGLTVPFDGLMARGASFSANTASQSAPWAFPWTSPNAGYWKRSISRRRRWRPSGVWPAAWRTTSTTC